MRTGTVWLIVFVVGVVLVIAGVARGDVVVDSARSYGLERVAGDIISGNTKLIVIGDSIATPSSQARAPAGILMTWAPQSWKGFSDGALGKRPIICEEDNLNSPSGLLTINAVNDPWSVTYRVGGTIGPQFSVPVNSIRELVLFWSEVNGGGVGLEAAGSRNSLLRFRLSRSWFDGIPAGSVIGNGMRTRVQYLYNSGATLINTALGFALWNGSGNIGVVVEANLETGGMFLDGGVVPDLECNALELPAFSGHDTTKDVEVLVRPPSTVTDEATLENWVELNHQTFTDFMGVVVYRDTPGLFMAAIADSSWDLDSHYEDVEPTPSVPKRYTDEQVLSWLRTIDVDSSQQPVFLVHLATESDAMDEFGEVVEPGVTGFSTEGFQRFAKDGLEKIIARYRTLSAAMGWAEPKFLLVGMWYRDAAMLTLPQIRNNCEGLSLAALEIAREDPSVGALSLYYDTDGIMFDGDNFDAAPWLNANSYGTGGAFALRGVAFDLTRDANLGGDLLDAAKVHQQDEQSAAFFAHRMWRMIVEDSCPADTNGDFVIDVNDISTTLFALGDTGMAGGGPTALVGDANRDGVVDVNDISKVLFALGDTCPGAAIGAWPPGP